MKRLIYFLPLICALLVVGPIEAKKKKYPNGDVYNGEMKKGKPYGEGQMIYANGNIYFGRWFNGYKHGFGIMNYANGNVYEGYWEDDNKHSKGTMKYENGDVYKGLWQFDSIYYGKMYYNNGNIYHGNWSLNKREGEGIMYYANKDIYNGQWKNGLKEGKGVLTDENKIIYEGEWKNDVLYEGNVKKTTILGNCIIKYTKGIKSTKATIKNPKWEYEGEIVDYIPFGYGTIKFDKNNKINVSINENEIKTIIIYSNNTKELKKLNNNNSLKTRDWIKNSSISEWLDSIYECIKQKEKDIKLHKHKIEAEKASQRIMTERKNKISKVKNDFLHQIWYPSEIYNIYRNNPAQLSYFKFGYTILHATIQDIECYTETNYNEFAQDFITTTMYRFYLQGGVILRVHEPHAVKLSKGQKVYLFTKFTDNVIGGRPIFNLNHILGNTQDAALNYILDLSDNGNHELYLRSKTQ